MDEIALRVENLSKRYTISAYGPRHDTLRDEVAHGMRALFSRNGHARRTDEDIWALKDVSFEISKGEVLGVIGRNGAGKSTLLKILSRITEPTSGIAHIRGRASSLLEVGTGFHPELSGSENIYLNGAILGMTKAEIERKFDEIVEFAEVAKFIDTPVKRYSSGMYVRLAFAVAAHLEPDVLIVDEVLAVGDAGFQKKCLGKMEGVAKEGRTILFVSHNMAAVENLCDRAIVLQGGRLEFSGSAKDAVGQYLRTFSEDKNCCRTPIIDLGNAPRRRRRDRPPLRRLEISANGDPSSNGYFQVGTSVTICVSVQLEKPCNRFDISLGFDNITGQRVLTVSSLFQPDVWTERLTGEQTVVCEIPSLTLVPGEYKIKVVLDVDGSVADSVEDAARITILEGDYYGTGKLPQHGFFVLPHRWYVNPGMSS